MKEGLVTLPSDVVILKENRDKNGKLLYLSDLPLVVIPDSEADKIRKAISFVKAEQALGNDKAGAFLISSYGYRVVIKDGSSDRSGSVIDQYSKKG